MSPHARCSHMYYCSSVQVAARRCLPSHTAVIDESLRRRSGMAVDCHGIGQFWHSTVADEGFAIPASQLLKESSDHFLQHDGFNSQ